MHTVKVYLKSGAVVEFEATDLKVERDRLGGLVRIEATNSGGPRLEYLETSQVAAIVVDPARPDARA
jgi:hypothetical protein